MKIKRVKNILLKPQTEWLVIKDEQTTISNLMINYAIILALIPVVAIFIGQSILGVSLGQKMSDKIPIANGVLYGFLYYVFSAAGIYILALLVDALSSSFGTTKNLIASLKIVVYSYTAFAVAGIVNIFFSLEWLHLFLGLYTFYLMYLGLRIVKETPREKASGFLLMVFILSTVLYLIATKMATAIALPIFGDLESINAIK
jgi:hypothetical protein